MSWNSQPYIVQSGDMYNQTFFDYASINPIQPVECCQQQLPLYFSLPDFNPSYSSLANFQAPELSQYAAGAEQNFIENEIDNDDDSDTSSDYSVQSPGEVPTDSYLADLRSEMEQGESINALLQRQNYSFKQEEEYAYSAPVTMSNNNNNQAAFTSHPLYDTYIALNELWSSSAQDLEYNPTDFIYRAQSTMNIACSNLNSMGGTGFSCDSVIRYQIGLLLTHLTELTMAVDVKPEYFNSDAVDSSIPSCGDFAQIDAPSIYQECSPVSSEVDAESSSDDTVKEEYVTPMINKYVPKRKRGDSVDDDEDEDDTEEDGDEEDEFSSKRPVAKDVQKKRRENYAPDISFELFSWWFDNDGAAPNAQAKQELASKTSKSISQIATWYQNAKRRYSARLEEFRTLKAQHPHEVRDYGSYEAFTRSQGSNSTTKRRRAQ